MSSNAAESSRKIVTGAVVNARDRAAIPSSYSSDPKFKKYTQQVEKCLNSFDSVHEWADFISFLKQLLKTFQAYMQFKEIPKKLVVSKRLSQCLNPALPTGVHQRALDVYAHILAVLGSEGLRRDLALWSSGLFPFFQYAATSVKPTLLNLFDTYYLPLQTGLRPVMKSFILALLPGLEEETGEFFDKVLGLLDRLSGTVSPSFFLQNIWLIMLTSPSSRGTSLTFLLRRLPHLNTNEDITKVVGHDIGLMIRAIAAALEDDNVLVRRGALDILIQSLRVDSVAVKNAQVADQAILTRAATSVVLRRDVSLNRRIYSWLLGPDENSQHQVIYLKTHALDLLKSTLREEMFNPSTEYSQSRPFKIFISLLDKWEIGSLLTDVLVLDAFKAIKKNIDSGADSGEDMSMTASTLYEAVEPHSLWKQLLTSALSDLTGDGKSCEGIQMINYLLTTYHNHDEEIETIHLPIIFGALLEVLTSCAVTDKSEMRSTPIQPTLLLLKEILKHIPPAGFRTRPKSTPEAKKTLAEQGPYTFACSFYGLEPGPFQTLPRISPSVPFSTSFEDLIALSISFGKPDILNPEAYIHSMDLLTSLVHKLQQDQLKAQVISWNPSEWLSIVLSSAESKTASFAIVDIVVSTIVKVQQANRLTPAFSIDQRRTMFGMIKPLLRYLRPPWAAYHMRAVSLIWLLERSSTIPHVESIIAQSLSSTQFEDVQEACEAFGVLWRLTDDALLPGFQLKVPMMIVLDTLKSDNPHLRRVGETWMRCSLKSYLRVLDPIIFELHDPCIRRSSTMIELNGRQLQGFYYERPFDQRYMAHLLDILLSVVKFGGQGFSKIARTTPVSRTAHSGLLERLQGVGGDFPDASYMDVTTHLLLRFLQSEPKPNLAPTMQPFNIVLQSTSVDLLQSVVVRGEVDMITLQTIESAIIGKLYLAVHSCRLDLQNKLLHLLHSVISALNAQASLTEHSPDISRQTDIASSSRNTSYTVNPLLVQTLIDGISVPSNHPIYQHWLDFILMTVPQFQGMLQSVIVPLNDSVCKQLRSALTDVLQASKKRSTAGDIVATTTDADFLMLLNAVERLVLLSLSQTSLASQDDEDGTVPDKQESTGLLGYVSGVFSSESNAGISEDQMTAKSSDYRCLNEAIQILYILWDAFVIPSTRTWTSQEESLSLIYTRTRTRCRRVLEHLFRTHSSEVLECVIDCWNQETLRSTSQDDSSAFELVDVLTSSAQNVVHMLCESISIRTLGLQDRTRRQALNPNLLDLTLFDFLEQYARRLENPLAVQVWGRFLQLAKDLASSFREFKIQAFSTLRCFTVLADKIIQTTIVEDRKVRKELQETYSKLLDICLLSGRSSEGTWMRRNHATLGANGRDSPIARVPSDAKLDEKMNASSASLPDTVKPPWGVDVTDSINLYIASDVLPNLRKFLADSDKILAAANSIAYSVISPAMKGRSRPLDVDDNVLSILREMTKVAAAVKAWRGPIVDVLNDNRCFNSTPEAGRKWRPMVKMLFETDKSAITELLSKVTTAPSANIFTNREYEMLLRSLNLRRLSYVLLTGEKNHFLTQLPTIQEKLVDTLRNVSAPIVQSEVYLCVRVLLCRLSPHNLSSFWPVILTELYRLFEQIMSTIPSDGSEELALILSASKLLDLLLVLQTEEFQIHQWIFITDTVDAVYRPDDWSPEAMLDRLAEVIGDLPAGEDGKHTAHGMPVAPTPTVDARPSRRPLLQALRQIDSIRDLVPFFSHASIASYESVYSSAGNVDWEAVEQGLLDDMFDGR